MAFWAETANAFTVLVDHDHAVRSPILMDWKIAVDRGLPLDSS
jgi:hypothetical protein